MIGIEDIRDVGRLFGDCGFDRKIGAEFHKLDVKRARVDMAI
jgi:hypothetical protein